MCTHTHRCTQTCASLPLRLLNYEIRLQHKKFRVQLFYPMASFVSLKVSELLPPFFFSKARLRA